MLGGIRSVRHRWGGSFLRARFHHSTIQVSVANGLAHGAGFPPVRTCWDASCGLRSARPDVGALGFRTGRIQKISMVVAGVLVLGAATIARLNYFEWMFHPVAQPGFEKADAVKLDAGEMVLALDFNGEARAYPIREMAYHHIVNDEVGGVPVAVTY